MIESLQLLLVDVIILQKQNMQTPAPSTAQRRAYWTQFKQQCQSQLTHSTHKIQSLLSTLTNLRTLHTLSQTIHHKLSKPTHTPPTLLSAYTPQHNYSSQYQPYQKPPYILQQHQQICLLQPCKQNWISKYLQRQDVVVYGRYAGNRVRVLGQCGGVVSFVNVDVEKLGHGNGPQAAGKGQVVEKSLGMFYAQNQQLVIAFVENKYKYQFGNSIVRLYINEQNGNQSHTILLQAKSDAHQQQQQIRRVIILRLQKLANNPSQSQCQSPQSPQSQQYRVYQGFYQPKNFIQPICLPPGQYIFLPFPNTSLSLYIQNPQSHHYQFDIIQPCNRKMIKQMNLFLQAFPQCHLQNVSAQYTRNCDFNIGIVVQVYRNGYDNEIVFQDLQMEGRKEDKKLMFQEMYPGRYRGYRLKRGEALVQFYEVTKKPAVLYQPKKKVIVDKDQDCQAQTIHSILK